MGMLSAYQIDALFSSLKSAVVSTRLSSRGCAGLKRLPVRKLKGSQPYQEFSLYLRVGLAENIFAGHNPEELGRFALVVRRTEREAAKCSLDPADIDVRARTGYRSGRQPPGSHALAIYK